MAPILTRADLMDLSDRLSEKSDKLSEKVDKVLVGVAVLEERSQTDTVRLTKVEGRVGKLEVTWSRALGVIATAMALGGGAGAVVAKLIP